MQLKMRLCLHAGMHATPCMGYGELYCIENENENGEFVWPNSLCDEHEFVVPNKMAKKNV
jgi:hypothetical protein